MKCLKKMSKFDEQWNFKTNVWNYFYIMLIFICWVFLIHGTLLNNVYMTLYIFMALFMALIYIILGTLLEI